MNDSDDARQDIELRVSASVLTGAVRWVRISFPLLLLLLFFMPWALISCSGQEMGAMSGYQLVRGEISLNAEFTAMSGGVEPAEPSEKMDSEWLLWFYALGLLALLLGAARAWAGRAAESRSVQNSVVYVMLGVMLFFLAFDFKIRRTFEKEMRADASAFAAPADEAAFPGAGQMRENLDEFGKNAFQVEKAWGFVLSFLLLCALAALGWVEVALAPKKLTRIVRMTAAERVPPPS